MKINIVSEPVRQRLASEPGLNSKILRGGTGNCHLVVVLNTKSIMTVFILSLGLHACFRSCALHLNTAIFIKTKSNFPGKKDSAASPSPTAPIPVPALWSPR